MAGRGLPKAAIANNMPAQEEVGQVTHHNDLTTPPSTLRSKSSTAALLKAHCNHLIAPAARESVIDGATGMMPMIPLVLKFTPKDRQHQQDCLLFTPQAELAVECGTMAG